MLDAQIGEIEIRQRLVRLSTPTFSDDDAGGEGPFEIFREQCGFRQFSADYENGIAFVERPQYSVRGARFTPASRDLPGFAGGKEMAAAFGIAAYHRLEIDFALAQLGKARRTGGFQKAGNGRRSLAEIEQQQAVAGRSQHPRNRQPIGLKRLALPGKQQPAGSAAFATG
jgi:hypothetical protein